MSREGCAEIERIQCPAGGRARPAVGGAVVTKDNANAAAKDLAKFMEELKTVKNRDDQDISAGDLVVSASEALWLSEEQTGNPSELGLLLRIPMRTNEFVLQRIPAGTATDLQRHVHESVHIVLAGSGWSEIGDKTVTWHQDDFVYTPPWIWHRHYADADAEVKMIIVENSRVIGALDAGRRESVGNVSFAEHFGVSESKATR